MFMFEPFFYGVHYGTTLAKGHPRGVSRRLGAGTFLNHPDGSDDARDESLTARERNRN
jgi:hypothetical protein